MAIKKFFWETVAIKLEKGKSKGIHEAYFIFRISLLCAVKEYY